jgi:hypothetical protein
MGMGTVAVSQRPELPVSTGRYQLLLTSRIEQLIAEADPSDVSDLLSQLETQENLRLVDRPNPAKILVECSQTLREKAGYPHRILPEEWQRDPGTETALQHETAVEYLLALVR